MLNYYTNDGHIDPIWVDSKAKEIAEKFANKEKMNRTGYGSGPKPIEMKSSQIRKFYADVKSLERQWLAASDKEAAFARILPMIKLLKAKSDYAFARKVVPESFRDWLWEHIDSIKTDKDFNAFLLHFEAVVGFSARYTKD